MIQNHSDLSNRGRSELILETVTVLTLERSMLQTTKPTVQVYLLLKLILGAGIFNWFKYNQFHQTLENMPCIAYAAQLLCESEHSYFVRFIHLFVFGCAGSSLLSPGFLQLQGAAGSAL